MRILVVGGAGYVGSTTVERLVGEGHEVTVYDDLSSGHRASVVEDATLEIGDIGDQAHLERVLADGRIDSVLHCAAKSLVGESMSEPGLYYRNNVAGGVALL
jgi:UDP-glucose 4-epimerase